jgi:ATP-dependent RNA circularization protein (DNA/RNA ligase family)
MGIARPGGAVVLGVWGVKKYHKIATVYERDPETKFRTLVEGQFATPELKYLKDCDWMFTEKVDGTNIRVMWEYSVVNGHGGYSRILFGGRTDEAQIPTFLFMRLQDLFSVERFATLYPDTSMCLYGEGYGAKIQRGKRYKPDGVDFVLFDVRVGAVWLERRDVEDVANKLGVGVVPFFGGGTLCDAIDTVKSGDLKSRWGDFQAEGLVMRPRVEMLDRCGNRIITKIKCKDFG